MQKTITSSRLFKQRVIHAVIGFTIIEVLVVLTLIISISGVMHVTFGRMMQLHSIWSKASLQIHERHYAHELIESELSKSGMMPCEQQSSKHTIYRNQSKRRERLIMLSGDIRTVTIRYAEPLSLSLSKIPTFTPDNTLDVTGSADIKKGDSILISNCMDTEWLDILDVKNIGLATKRLYFHHPVQIVLHDRLLFSKMRSVQISSRFINNRHITYVRINEHTQPLSSLLEDLQFEVDSKGIRFSYHSLFFKKKFRYHGYALFHES